MAAATWAMPANVDVGCAPVMLRELDAQLAAVASGADRQLAIDVTTTQTFDTSLIALMLEARRRLHAAGGQLTVRGAPPKLIELAKLYGVDELVLG